MTVALPVGAMLDAAGELRITASEWAGPLWSPQVHVMPLTDIAAREIGCLDGALGVRHAVWEAGHLGWPIMTSQPDRYTDGSPLLVFG